LEALRRLEVGAKFAPGLERIAKYKEGFCWFELAAKLRREVIVMAPQLRSGGNIEVWYSYYEAIYQALRITESYFTSFAAYGNLETLPIQMPFATYNIACIYSLWAQYKVEEALTCESEHIINLSRALTDDEPEKHEESFWQEFGSKWRDCFGHQGGTLLERDVDSMLQSCMATLSIMADECNSKFSQSITRSDLEFLVTNSQKDFDLRFVRWEASSSSQFIKWGKANRIDNATLEHYKRLIAKLSPELKKALKIK
jgi:hypothetical protein